MLRLICTPLLNFQHVQTVSLNLKHVCQKCVHGHEQSVQISSGGCGIIVAIVYKHLENFEKYAICTQTSELLLLPWIVFSSVLFLLYLYVCCIINGVAMNMLYHICSCLQTEKMMWEIIMD